MERKTIHFNAKVKPIKPINDEFTLCKVYVCALGKNRNLSFISKETADDALATLYNCPVIGHMYTDEQGNHHMGGHDMVIAQGKDGAYYYKSLCVPYGVIPQQDSVHYEEVEEPEGRGKKTYVVADCILWTGRYPELKDAIYADDCWFGQSMEIGIKEHEALAEDKNYMNILKFSYSALCLLGKSDDPDFDVQPCFPESKVEPYEFALANAQFADLMVQLKEELASCFGNAAKGGESMEVNEVVNTETLTENENFEQNNEVNTPVNDAEQENDTQENFVENEAEENVKPTFASTYNEKRNAINVALMGVGTIEQDEDGDVVYESWFDVCDFDDAYVFVEKGEYKKGEGCKRRKGRFAYTFDESTNAVTIQGQMEEMFVKWLTKEEVDQLEEQRNQLSSLVEYKAMREKQDREAEFDAALVEFADLEGNEEYAAVLENKYGYETVDALKNACYIIRGKFSIVAPKTSTRTNIPSVSIGNEEKPNTYDAFFAKYGKRK